MCDGNVLCYYGLRTFLLRAHPSRPGATRPEEVNHRKAYELLYIVDPSSNEEVRAGVSARIDVAISNNGGKVDDVEDWGKRKLAYEIDGLSEGDYVLINFHADPTQIQELDRVLRINDAVKRHMIVARYEQE